VASVVVNDVGALSAMKSAMPWTTSSQRCQGRLRRGCLPPLFH